MANPARAGFEWLQFREVLHRMRMGECDRPIAKTRLIGRLKCGQVCAIAKKNRLLGAMALPNDVELTIAFEPGQAPNCNNKCLSLLCEPQNWTQKGTRWRTINRTLVDRFDFDGTYSSVRRLAQNLRKKGPMPPAV